MVSVGKTKKFKAGPESQQFGKFKGKHVTVTMPGGNIVAGKLVWVDVYTIGILVHPEQPEPIILYKGPGVAIGLTDQSDILSPWTGKL